MKNSLINTIVRLVFAVLYLFLFNNNSLRGVSSEDILYTLLTLFITTPLIDYLSSIISSNKI